MKLNKLLPIFLCTIPIAWIIIDLIINDKLEDANVDFTNSIQKPDGSGWDTFFKVISYFYAPEVVPVILVLLFCLPKKKVPGIKLAVYCTTTLYIFSILKMIYSQARPYQRFDVHPKVCEQDFGRPSGHAMGGMVLWSCIYWLFISDLNLTEKNVKANKIFKYSMLILIVALIFTIGMSRVYLGVHSFPQILLGWSYGALFLIFSIAYFDKILQEKIEQAYNSTKKGLHSGVITAVLVAVLTIPMIVYGIRENSKDYGVWYLAIVFKCKEEPKVMNTFYEAQFGASTNIVIVFGMFYGLVALKEVKQEFPKFLKIYKEFLRLIVYIVLIGGTIGVFNFAIPHSETSAWINFFFLQCLPNLIGGFLLILVAPYILNRLNICRENDFLEVELAKSLPSNKVSPVTEYEQAPQNA
jgi:Membrane-associated phospholipid phosphatase